MHELTKCFIFSITRPLMGGPLDILGRGGGGGRADAKKFRQRVEFKNIHASLYVSVNSIGDHPPRGISHFWKVNGYVPTPRKEEL
jgi:hypothetical protein